MKKSSIKVTKQKQFNKNESQAMYKRSQQIAYCVDKMINGKGIRSTLKFVHSALGIEYVPIKKSEHDYGYFKQVSKALPDFAQAFKKTGGELYKLQKECEEVNPPEWEHYGIDVTSKAFKAIMKNTKAKPKKKQAFKIKNKNDEAVVNAVLEAVKTLGVEALPELIKQAKGMK